MENIDTKEFEVPETIFSRDIETRVIQVIIVQCLEKLEGVSLIGGNLIDTLFGREVEKVKGIFVEQDSKNHMVKVKVEIQVVYGVSIPEKSEQVQNKVVEEITRLTGLHVASVHVVVKGLTPPKPVKEEEMYPASLLVDEEETDEFTRA
ncbi:MAG: hypothetical protein K940chlam9_01057 [Chlamydiae bacterium]|nr:hypothetical protein [Chlamydiota bacterium]